MTPTRWQHIQGVVNDAIELPPQSRAAFLEEICGSDAEVRRQVESLIESYEQANSFLERAVEATAFRALSPASPVAGERIGPYQIIDVIGHGGMGTVYCARRDDAQFSQTVAIKVLRGGIGNSLELEMRFRVERQILARLTHPNIARLLDGGITPHGLPYLVMEYIEGPTIDSYCRESEIGLAGRVELFRQVCAAVQYAHQNLIVHRDIKPANILVAPDGSPKLLDFGIAKLLGANSGDDAVPMTRPAERLMTPEYASPEQIRGEAVTTATDVYALGVLLYELISGKRPFRAANLSPTGLERMICETAPQAPSLAAQDASSGSGEKIGSDLDNIVLKALHKDPARRYASAAELSEDLRRYLTGFPIQARADSWWYRARRFVARHWLATSAALLFVVTVTSLAIGLAFATRRERNEAAMARGISDFLVSLLGGISPESRQGRTASVRDILDRGAERIPAELAGQPLVEARLFNILGTTYREFGAFDRAEALLNRAQTLYSDTLGPDSREAAESLFTLATIASDRGEFDRSGQLYQKVLAIYARLNDRANEKAIQAIEGLGEVRRMLGDLSGAKQRYVEAIALYTQTLGASSLRTLSAKNDLVAVLANQSDYAGAEVLAEENVKAEKAALGPDNPNVAWTLNLLAYALGRTARFGDASTALRQALDIQRKVYGAEHPAIALNLSDLSALERELGHYSESRSLAEEALAMSVKLSGPRSLGTANCAGQLGLTELAMGDIPRAKELLQSALSTREALGNPNNPDLGDNLDRMGLVYLATNDLTMAHRDIERGLQIRQNVYGPANENVTRSLNHMARVLVAEHQYRAAEEHYREALGIAETNFKRGHTMTADALLGLGEVLLLEGRAAEAHGYLARALELRRRLLPAEHPGIAEAAAALARCERAGQGK